MRMSQRIGFKSAIFAISLFSQSLFAAQLIDLYSHPMVSASLSKTADQVVHKTYSKNGMTHLHMQQMYHGVPVWGAAYVAHIPKATNALDSAKMVMNGTVYQGLDADLLNTANQVFTHTQMQAAIDAVQKANHLRAPFKHDPKAQLMVFVDKKHQAHYAFLVQFSLNKQSPTYIVDALTFQTYEQWDNYKTLDRVNGGGLGGNGRVGVFYYDGQTGHLPTLTFFRDPTLNICYLRDDYAVLRNIRSNLDVIQFKCETPSRQHGNLYWDSHEDEAGGSFSPSNDTLYAADIMYNLFWDWFQIPVWTDQYGKKAKMVFFMHDADANASFTEDGYILVGDATNSTDFYSFGSLDVIAHEMGHAVTFQNSNLWYSGEYGGINESFSDMTAKAAEFYAYGELKTWNIGNIMVNPDAWLRYMDQPSKDCAEGEKPGVDCSADSVDQIDPGLDVHYTSGIFNRVFYQLATTPNWTVKKAYTLMLEANQHYWTNYSGFCQASRGVWIASQTLGYNEADVLAAFAKVGIDPKTCSV